MRTILISLILAGIVSAEVPSLINYQGRLTNADGEPLTGTKNFGLKIFDAQTDGNLLYTEDVGAIQLGEGGVYSFQFGGTGTSNTQITEKVGNGNGEDLYQKVLSNTPVVEGSVSVSDGTYTWSQASGSSNEDDFNAAFSINLNRITVNYFAGAPNDSRQIEVTYRYEAEGIIGALSSGSGHWLQLSVDGETQASRERVLAVPFALRAGVAETVLSKKPKFIRITSGSVYLDKIINPLRMDLYLTNLYDRQGSSSTVEITIFKYDRKSVRAAEELSTQLKSDPQPLGDRGEQLRVLHRVLSFEDITNNPSDYQLIAVGKGNDENYQEYNLYRVSLPLESLGGFDHDKYIYKILFEPRGSPWGIARISDVSFYYTE